MPWQLEIHIIDVGQGESSLIVADDGAGQSRTMLIDAGLPIYGETVHDYIVQKLNGRPLDHILVSHYDADHSGGIKSLLIADNLYRLSETIAEAAGAAAFDAVTNGRDVAHQIAAGAAAAAAAARGAYHIGANDYRNVAVAAGQDQWNSAIAAGTTGAEIARDAVLDGESIAAVSPNLNAILLPATATRRKAAQQAGIEAGNVAGNAAVRTAAALTSVHRTLLSAVPPGSRFRTDALYRNMHVIDIGNTPHMANDYPWLIGGSITLTSGHRVLVPGTNRTRTSVDGILGAEILWNSGPAPMAAPVSSPALFVVACLKRMWRAPANAVPIASGQPDNDDSIGLAMRFNRFFYYTGGDLPSQGEDLVATALRNWGLSDPQNLPNTFGPAARLACFKCGHHGSNRSTSDAFLATTQASAAFISAGYKPFGHQQVVHPEQQVVNRLHNAASISRFYLTNCREQRANVPASQAPPRDQLPPPNKSRLAGDNALRNLRPGRRRGDIFINLTEAGSTGAPPAGRRFSVRYYEADHPAGDRITRIPF
ncbi:MAG TPA: MBL fold metallo-hydrolase [Thermoanaerobaculia bacterium]|jgi:beta-lactamase superfamily II metal-dependent hydrolase|nr:MBL fold metallo-hydrolase [Thermoanaerobaculia bacterium]